LDLRWVPFVDRPMDFIVITPVSLAHATASLAGFSGSIVGLSDLQRHAECAKILLPNGRHQTLTSQSLDVIRVARHNQKVMALPSPSLKSLDYRYRVVQAERRPGLGQPTDLSRKWGDEHL